MFEPKDRLYDDVRTLLEAIRHAGSSEYTALLDASGLLLESADGDSRLAPRLRGMVAENAKALFSLPAAMEGAGPSDDVFAAFPSLGFVLAVLNGRVALLCASPNASTARAALESPFATLADRLFRLNPAWRTDEKGRGIFFSRPRVDWVVIERSEA